MPAGGPARHPSRRERFSVKSHQDRLSQNSISRTDEVTLMERYIQPSIGPAPRLHTVVHKDIA